MEKITKTKLFTLVELLMVCGIIVVLVGISIGVFSLVTRNQAEAKTKAMIEKMCIALEAYKNKTGYYIQQAMTAGMYIDKFSGDVHLNQFIEIPDSELSTQAPSWSRGAWKDAFDRQFLYKCPGSRNRSSFDLWSLGNNPSDPNDDITNWK